MKRPRWLLGGGSDEEEGDGDTGADASRDEREDEARPSPAAERSARRTARKTLAERVAAEAPNSDEESEAKPKPKDKPKSEKRSESSSAGPVAGQPSDEKRPQSSSAGPVAGQPHPAAKRRGAGRPVRRHPRPDASEPSKSKAKPGDAKVKREVHRPKAQKDTGKPRAKPRSSDREDEGKKARPGKRAGRKPLGPRVRGAASGGAKALKRGAVETRKQVADSAPKVGRRLLGVAAAIFAVVLAIVGFAAGLAVRIWLWVSRPISWVLVRLRRLIDTASRLLTPVRVLALVTAGAAILLALSQYADYRSISIGNDAYSGVQSIAPAPETARAQTGDAHSYVFVPVAVVCLILLAGALTGRWRLCRLIAIAGAAAIVVAIVVDRPEGLDPGDAAVAFEGVEAKLIGGFYAQIAAGVLLIGSSTLLARELRLAGVAERSAARSGRRVRKGALRAPDAGSARA